LLIKFDITIWKIVALWNNVLKTYKVITKKCMLEIITKKQTLLKWYKPALNNWIFSLDKNVSTQFKIVFNLNLSNTKLNYLFYINIKKKWIKQIIGYLLILLYYCWIPY